MKSTPIEFSETAIIISYPLETCKRMSALFIVEINLSFYSNCPHRFCPIHVMMEKETISKGGLL